MCVTDSTSSDPWSMMGSGFLRGEQRSWLFEESQSSCLPDASSFSSSSIFFSFLHHTDSLSALKHLTASKAAASKLNPTTRSGTKPTWRVVHVCPGPSRAALTFICAFGQTVLLVFQGS